MNRENSYIVSFAVTFCVAAFLYDWKHMPEVSIDWATPFLIYWYMTWKLLHVKSKD